MRSIRLLKPMPRSSAELPPKVFAIPGQQFPIAWILRKIVGILIFCFVNGAVMMLAWISQFTSQAKGFAQYGSLGKEGTTG